MASVFSRVDQAGNVRPFGVRFWGGTERGSCFQFFESQDFGGAVCFVDDVGRRVSRGQFAEVVFSCQTRWVEAQPDEEAVWAQVVERFGEVVARRVREGSWS